MRGLEQKQGELRDKLQGLQKKLPQGSDKSAGAMKDADGAMGGAQDYLQQNAPAGALPEQGKALESMRKGAQALMREQGTGEGGGQGYGFNQGEGQGDMDAPSRYNPFSMGDDMTDGNRVPEGADRKTIQDILDEVKRRLSDPRPAQAERDYLRAPAAARSNSVLANASATLSRICGRVKGFVITSWISAFRFAARSRWSA